MPRVLFASFLSDISYACSLLARLALDQGHQAEVVSFSGAVTSRKFAATLRKYSPEVLCISFMLYSRDDAIRLARLARSRGIKTVAGGVHPTLCPVDVVAAGCFDCVVKGDGAGVLAVILKEIQNMKGALVEGKAHTDQAVYFRRHFSPVQEKLLRAGKTYDLFTALGCPYNCGFCSRQRRGVQNFDMKLVVQALQQARLQYGARRVRLLDNIFNLHHRRLRSFSHLLEKTNLKFRFSVNAHVDRFDIGTAELFKKIGVEKVWFGMECMSDKMLKFLNKRFVIRDAHRAAELCRKHHLLFCAYFIVGLPRQTRADYEATLKFIRNTVPDRITVSYFTPYPGSSLFDYCVNNGYMTRKWGYERYLQSESDERTGEKFFSGLNRIDYGLADHYRREFQSAAAQSRGLKVILKPTENNFTISNDELRNTLLGNINIY